MNTLPKIEWNKAFETGIPSVDFEHQQIIKLVNKVIAKVSESVSPDEIVEVLGELFAQISAHFALEESIMRRDEYVDYLPHKEDHEHLLDDIRDMMDAYEARSYNDNPIEFITRLNDWFIGHFSTRDAKLHQMIKNHK